MNSMQALQQFWAGFKLPAYDETTVPDNAEMPYITYESSRGYFSNSISMTASLWYYSPSWAEIQAKETEIASFITLGGRQIAYDGGGMWIKRGTPWAQRMSDQSDKMIRRIVLNIEIEFFEGR